MGGILAGIVQPRARRTDHPQQRRRLGDWPGSVLHPHAEQGPGGSGGALFGEVGSRESSALRSRSAFLTLGLQLEVSSVQGLLGPRTQVSIMIRLGVALAILATPSFAQAIFVDDSATGAANGSSWHDAFTDLQNAFLVSSQGDQIWVAVGTYRPGPPAGNRDTPFAIPDGVALYGGFDATEATLAERGLDLFEQTLLSGDLNGNDGPGFVGVSDNSYHVVATGVLANPTTLDGFLIMGGNANGPGSGEQDGGGLTTSGSLIVRNVVFPGEPSGRGRWWRVCERGCKPEVRGLELRGQPESW